MNLRIVGENGFALVLCALMMMLAFSVAVHQSVTTDEYSIAPNGLAILKARAFQIDCGVAPLAKILTGIPLWIVGACSAPESLKDCESGWQNGQQFLLDNSSCYHDIFMSARIMPTLALGGVCWIVFVIGRRLYGRGGGLVALGVACLTPELIAHGALATSDIFVTFFVLLSLWAYDKFTVEGGAMNGILLGLAMGCAATCKFTGLLLIPFYLLMVALLYVTRNLFHGDAVSGGNSRVGMRHIVWILVSLLVCLAVINAVYLFGGVFTPFGRYEFQTETFKILQGALPGWLPVPLPFYFVKGIDVQMAEKGYMAYLCGQINLEGFPEYYLIALLVKTPIPFVLMLAAAIAYGGCLREREIPLAVFSLFIVAVLSFLSHKNIGIRYLLVVYPIGAILIGRVWSAVSGNAWKTCGLFLLLALQAFNLCRSWPHYLSFFNSLAGGSRGGHRFLLDSNLDWGQDLIALKRVMDREGIACVDLAVAGRVPPEVYGISYRHFKGGVPSCRFVAISANLLWGRTYFMNGTGFWPPAAMFEGYRKCKPAFMAGDSIYIFDTMKSCAAEELSP